MSEAWELVIISDCALRCPAGWDWCCKVLVWVENTATEEEAEDATDAAAQGRKKSAVDFMA